MFNLFPSKTVTPPPPSSSANILYRSPLLPSPKGEEPCDAMSVAPSPLGEGWGEATLASIFFHPCLQRIHAF